MNGFLDVGAIINDTDYKSVNNNVSWTPPPTPGATPTMPPPSTTKATTASTRSATEDAAAAAAQLKETKEFYAIKAIHKSLMLDNDTIDMAELESKIMFTNQHKNLINMDYSF